MATFYQYLPVLVISFLQTCFILAKGYFLSIEFTLYPYLIKNGFIPYKEIIDQHFPSLFFGSFSLPLLSQNSHLPLLLLLLILNFASSILLYRYLLFAKSSRPILYIVLYTVLMSYFSANTLWVEIFINFLIVLSLNLDFKKNTNYSFFIGIIFSQIILMRPTLFVSIFILSLFWCQNYKKVLIGAAIGLLITSSYFAIHQNLFDFYKVAIKFNFEVYSKASSLVPSLRQIVLILLPIASLTINFPQTSKSKFLFLCTIFSLLAAYPRFGLEHLQPFILLFTIYLAQYERHLKFFTWLIVLVFLVQILLGLYKNRYGNYFFGSDVRLLAEKISALPHSEVFLFGASDLLYPLSNRVPPGQFYIPSLPWYINYPPFQDRLLLVLEKSGAPVVVDTQFSVDSKKLIEESSQVYEYIKMNYNLVETTDNIEIYLKKNENSY